MNYRELGENYIKREYMLNFNELKKYFSKADFTDVKIFEGETSLRKFIASMLSYTNSKLGVGPRYRIVI
jgi:hypothetical protein